MPEQLTICIFDDLQLEKKTCEKCFFFVLITNTNCKPLHNDINLATKKKAAIHARIDFFFSSEA